MSSVKLISALLVCTSTLFVTSTLVLAQTQSRVDSHSERQEDTAQRINKGLDLIEAGIHVAGACGPEATASAYFLAGHALATIRPTLAKEMYSSAYRTLDEIRDANVPGVSMLEDNITRETTDVIPDDVEQALPKDKELHDTAVAELVRVYVKKKHYKHAVELTRLISDPALYPAIRAVLDGIPTKDTVDRATVYSVAIEKYRESRHTANIIAFPEDLGSLTSRFWKTLPPSQVLEAINVLIDEADSTQASKPSESANRSSLPALTIHSSHGTRVVSFLDYRLQQLIPILQKLDPQSAEALASRLNRPKILEDARDAEPSHEAQSSTVKSQIAVSRNTGEALRSASAMQQQQLISDISAAALDDPNTAIDRASAIQDVQLRAWALVTIANAIAGKNPTESVDALRRIRSQDDKDHIPSFQVMQEAATLARKAGEELLAREFISSCFKAARAAYDHDSDDDHPNHAIKLYWPSTHLWRDAFLAAYKLDPGYSVQMLDTVPDQEVSAIERIFLASAFLGVPVWNADSPIGE